MARIRTVKPEFWADEKISKLPRDARLLFIGLFNFADDAGRMRGNPLLVRAQVFPYDADIDSENLLRTLAEASLITRYEVAQESYIWIRNFNRHQKIDKPTDSVLPAPDSKERQRHSAKARRTLADDSALERKGKEGNGSGKGMEILAPQETAAPHEEPAPTSGVWNAYSEAFETRYRVKPADNAKARSLLKQFIQRIPREEAPLVAASFLRHNDALYVRAKHPIELLLRDYQKLHTEWQTGQQVTATEARQIEKTQANLDGWGKHIVPIVAEVKSAS